MSKTIKRTQKLEINGEALEFKAIPLVRIISIVIENRGLGQAIQDAISGDFTAFAIFEDMTQDTMFDLIDGSMGWNAGKAKSQDWADEDVALAALTALDLTIPEDEKKTIQMCKAGKSILEKIIRTAGVAS